MMQKLKPTFTSCFSPGILKHLIYYRVPVFGSSETVGHIWNWSKTKFALFHRWIFRASGVFIPGCEYQALDLLFLPHLFFPPPPPRLRETLVPCNELLPALSPSRTRCCRSGLSKGNWKVLQVCPVQFQCGTRDFRGLPILNRISGLSQSSRTAGI